MAPYFRGIWGSCVVAKVLISTRERWEEAEGKMEEQGGEGAREEGRKRKGRGERKGRRERGRWKKMDGGKIGRRERR